MSREFSSTQANQLLQIVKKRFTEHPERHPDLRWEVVREHLEADRLRFRALWEMERTGGEPDVISQEANPDRILFVDCAPETPSGRRGVCYDLKARKQRKSHRPETSAREMADQMGVEMLDEAQYLMLQEFGAFDMKTSSWLYTPESLRTLGGALFGDRRYGRVFIYHNGAQSYYQARGFRCRLVI
jgi:hypothetical protein